MSQLSYITGCAIDYLNHWSSSSKGAKYIRNLRRVMNLTEQVLCLHGQVWLEQIGVNHNTTGYEVRPPDPKTHTPTPINQGTSGPDHATDLPWDWGSRPPRGMTNCKPRCWPVHTLPLKGWGRSSEGSYLHTKWLFASRKGRLAGVGFLGPPARITWNLYGYEEVSTFKATTGIEFLS